MNYAKSENALKKTYLTISTDIIVILKLSKTIN